IQYATGATAGNETALYDPGTSTLTITIEEGKSTANQVVAAINAEASGLFSAEIDRRDDAVSAFAGLGTVELGAQAVTSGGSGTTLDITSGLLVTNGGETSTIDVSGAETVEQLLNILNKSNTGLVARINEAGTGIDVRSTLSGANLTIGEVGGGETATQLGIRTLH